MRNIGKSTGPLEWWAPPFFFTSETPRRARATQKRENARNAPPAGRPRCFNHTRLGTGPGGILVKFPYV